MSNNKSISEKYKEVKHICDEPLNDQFRLMDNMCPNCRSLIDVNERGYGQCERCAYTIKPKWEKKDDN